MRELKEAIVQFDVASELVADETLDFKEFGVAIGIRDRALFRIVAVAGRMVAESEKKC